MSYAQVAEWQVAMTAVVFVLTTIILASIAYLAFRIPKVKDAVLRRLLRWVRDDLQGRWLTEETMRVAHSFISYWATELVVTRFVAGRWEVLLAKYDGGIEEFRGKWHLPGGYNQPRRSKSFGTACFAVAERELGINLKRILPNRFRYPCCWWGPRQHPYGRPLSIFVECELDGEIEETDKLRYFPIGELPEHVVPLHHDFMVYELLRLLPQ